MINNIAIFETFTMLAGRGLFNSVQRMGTDPRPTPVTG